MTNVSSNTSLAKSDTDETDRTQSTMWLGTEDGCVHVYNCTDNIRIKKNKIKIQHSSAVYSILWVNLIEIYCEEKINFTIFSQVFRQ